MTAEAELAVSAGFCPTAEPLGRSFSHQQNGSGSSDRHLLHSPRSGSQSLSPLSLRRGPGAIYLSYLLVRWQKHKPGEHRGRRECRLGPLQGWWREEWELNGGHVVNQPAVEDGGSVGAAARCIKAAAETQTAKEVGEGF